MVMTEVVEQMEKELHDLCQPLTTLQCRLELAEMCADEASLMEAVRGGLQETERMFVGIEGIRTWLQVELTRVKSAEKLET
ncbi:MAG: hypothetical protein ABI142_09985 [Bryocella sp.]